MSTTSAPAQSPVAVPVKVGWEMSRTLTTAAKSYMAGIPKHNKQPYVQKPYVQAHPEIDLRAVHAMRMRNTWNVPVGEWPKEKKPQYSNLGQLDYARSKRMVCAQAPSDRFAKPVNLMLIFRIRTLSL